VIPFGAIAAGVLAANRRGQQGDAASLNVAMRFLVATFALLFVILAFQQHLPFVQVPMLVASVAVVPLLFFPAFTLSRVVVPLGLPRLAHAVARLSPPVASSAEMRAAAVFYGALAALRARSLDPETLAWLEDRLTHEVTLRATSLAAAGLLAAARGRPESARLLFAAVDALTWRTAPRAVRRVARSWLVADAARRGDFRLVASLGRGRGSYMRWPWLMGAIAERLIGAPRAPSDAVLYFAWIAAPHRRATWPMVRRALAAPRGAAGDPARAREGAGDPPLDPLGAALRAHAASLGAPSEAALLAAGRAWDAARDAPATNALIARRALALEARSSVDAVFLRLVESVERDLEVPAARAPAHIVATSPTLAAAASRARQRDLDEIDLIAKRLTRRTAQKETLHVIEEWMEWSSLRRLCERVLRDADASVHRAVFTSIFSGTCNYAVWLFNVRGEKLLGNTIFRWLLAVGRGVADEAATKLLTKNVAAGHGP